MTSSYICVHLLVIYEIDSHFFWRNFVRYFKEPIALDEKPSGIKSELQHLTKR